MPKPARTPPPAAAFPLNIDRKDGKIFSHVRQKWLVETPEERVRQAYVVTLHNEYGFGLDQLGEEEHTTGRGKAKARADIVVWRSAQDKSERTAALIVVECKSDNVAIDVDDYGQGEAYALYASAPFFVTHNSRETKYWRTRKEKMPGHCEEIDNIPRADASDKDIEELIKKLKTFKEHEFADLLHKCHNVIRNREHLDPAAAFDEIAKMLFVKVYVERDLRSKRRRDNIFNVDYLRALPSDDPANMLFEQTKKQFRGDAIFASDEKINLRPATSEKIVAELQSYNLSDTSEDVKGIAFERFLGRTFRGEIGQFFTPRSIVDFMVRMVDPQEGEIICDPASGSGGFLIRCFERVRQQILADADREYRAFKKKVEATEKKKEDRAAELLSAEYERIQRTLDQRESGSRMWTLSNRCIYGCDANDRMARTSKMNMILHGDGHGGVHHHNGFLNVNGIFEQRFDIILTNPPFGANVEPEDKITDDQIRYDPESAARYRGEYGDLYTQALARVRAAKNEPLASLFELPRRSGETLGKIKTEILFIERCLSLLKPGGRMGIVLPEGIFNNPSLAYVREFCEDRARILAVVSLPQETFLSSGASVKASLLFVQKFAAREAADFTAKQAKARAEVEKKHAPDIAAKTAQLESEIQAAKAARDTEGRKAAQKELREYLAKVQDQKTCEARALLKERFDYPIFLYEAEKVGITATGEPDANELNPNENLPAGTTAADTCLELYKRFKTDPESFMPGRVTRGNS